MRRLRVGDQINLNKSYGVVTVFKRLLFVLIDVYLFTLGLFIFGERLGGRNLQPFNVTTTVQGFMGRRLLRNLSPPRQTLGRGEVNNGL